MRQRVVKCLHETVVAQAVLHPDAGNVRTDTAERERRDVWIGLVWRQIQLLQRAGRVLDCKDAPGPVGAGEEDAKGVVIGGRIGSRKGAGALRATASRTGMPAIVVTTSPAFAPARSRLLPGRTASITARPS